MTNKVALSDDVVQANIDTCIEHVKKIRALKETNPKRYKKVVAYLQEIAEGKRTQGIHQLISPEMADSVLDELDEENTISRTRQQLEEAFMGNDEMYVPLEDALKNKEDAAAIREFGESYGNSRS
jgi:hypothetical protein